MININILLSSDDNYALLTGVLIQSLLIHNSSEFQDISIYILDGGIANVNKSKIDSVCQKFNNINLYFIEYDNIEDMVGIDMKVTVPFTAYARLFAESLLPKDIEKILYLDVDGVVNGSLKEVYETNIDDYYIAAVEDMGPNYINHFLNLPDETAHYNSGFLLINLKKWREDNLEKEFIDCIIKFNGEVYHNDQGVINIVCRDKILKLPPEYNIHAPFFGEGFDKILKFYGVSQYYTKEITENAIKNPIFIHFVQFVYGRPWFRNAENHPLRETFDFYASQTPFKNEVYTEDNRGFLIKFLSLAYKIFPFSLLCWMFDVYRKIAVKINFRGFFE